MYADAYYLLSVKNCATNNMRNKKRISRQLTKLDYVGLRVFTFNKFTAQKLSKIKKCNFLSIIKLSHFLMRNFCVVK